MGIPLAMIVIIILLPCKNGDTEKYHKQATKSLPL